MTWLLDMWLCLTPNLHMCKPNSYSTNKHAALHGQGHVGTPQDAALPDTYSVHAKPSVSSIAACMQPCCHKCFKSFAWDGKAARHPATDTYMGCMNQDRQQ